MRMISFLFLCAWLPAAAQIKFDSTSLEDALQRSRATERPVFLYANASWCEPCEVLEDYTFQDLEVANYFNDTFINVQLDMEEYPGIELAEQYDIMIYPAMLFLDADGKVLHRGCGSMDSSDLLLLGQEVYSDSSLSSYDRRFKQGERDIAFLFDYISLKDAVCLDAEGFARKLMNEYAEAELPSESAFLLIENFQWDIFSREFQLIVENKELFVDSLGADRVDAKIYNTYLAQFEEIYQAEELHLFALRALMKEMERVAFEGRDTLSLMINLHYHELMEDWEAFSNDAIEWIGMSGTADPFELNELAWKFYLYVDDGTKLEIAANWAKSAVDTEPTPSAIDTYASLLFKLGDKKQAVALEEQALEMAQKLLDDTSHFEHQLAKFQKK